MDTQVTLEQAFEGQFMQPVGYHGEYVEFESTMDGCDMIIPAEYYDDTMGKVIERGTGWLARLSASGYLDCTDWTVHDTRQEAMDYLIDTYGNDLD